MPPELPLDVARLIFEKAVEDKPLPIHLALVSRRTQYWVEPLIYRNLTFHDATSFAAFYRTFRNRRFSKSKSTTFFAENVKSLHIYGHATPEMEQLIALGRGLKGLKSVAAWYISHACYVVGFLAYDCTNFPTLRALDLNFTLSKLRAGREEWRDEQERRRRKESEADTLFTYPELEALREDQDAPKPMSLTRKVTQDPRDPFFFKDLRRFSTSVQALRELRLDFTHRIFRDLTHLDIYYFRAYDWSTIVALTNLTHIALNFMTIGVRNHSFTEMALCMDDTLQYCKTLPYLKVIVLACVNWWSNDFDVLDESSSSLNPSPEAWAEDGPLISNVVHERSLHYFTRMSLGMHDPRIVLGIVSEGLAPSHLLKDYMVDLTWPKQSYDWDFVIPQQRHRESWQVAEDIIAKRKRERNERRRALGVPLIDWDSLVPADNDREEDVDGEFGFGDLVRQRWIEHSKI